MDAITIHAEVECRASEAGPTLHGTVIQEGRAARGHRAEVFAPGAVCWPADGIGVSTEHLGAVETRAVPTREPDGRITITAPATPAIFAAVKGGKRYMSVEFQALREVRTAAGVREIERAIVDQAALTDRPEYHQTAAEVREEPASEAPYAWLR